MLDAWTSEPEIIVAGYRCRTDFEGFFEALRAGQMVILCRWASPPFFSRDRSTVSKSRRTAARRFRDGRIAYILPTEPEVGEAEEREGDPSAR